MSALSDITVDLANSTATGFKADLGNPIITAGVLTATPDIPIGGVIVYKIKAKVTDKAVGFITNTAIVDGDAVSNQVGPSIDKPEIKKEVLKFYKPDGTTVLTNRYMPGGFIEYKVTLKNTGKGILNNGTFLDEIGAITTNYATTGVTGPAFDSWTITKLSETGASTVADINNSIPLGTEVLNSAAKPKIEGLMDIHPGGEIVYIIKAKINENAVGNITNTASLNGLKSAVTSLMQNPTINHTKQVFEENGTTVKTTFLPGDKVVYKMRVENTGFGTSASKTYTDIVANIVGEIAETPGSVAIPTANVFASYTASFTTSGGNVTTIGSAGLNQTINLPNSVTIAPGGWIEFRIDATLKDTVIGRFTNRSTYDGNNKDVSLNPVPPVITAKKTLTKLNGVDFVAGMTYAPGDSVEYKVEIENIGSSFFNNLAIGDNLDAIVTSLTGDATGKGLENISISSPVVTNTLSKPVLTDIKPSAGNSSTNLQVEVDFAPKDKIVYTITGNIVKSAIGTIPANIAIVNGVSYPSNPINPKAPIISSKKELIAPANKIYGPNEVVEYKITIENTGEGFGNDIKIVDLISDIKTTLLNGSQGQAFANWTITSLITHSNTAFNGQTILQNALADNTNINTEVDIAPSGKVEITIKATTSSLAAGEIVNIAKIDNVEKPSDKINPRTAVVEFNKVPLITGSTTYTPGGDIGFRLVLSNTSTNAIAKDINLSDLVSTIKVDSSNGGQVPAFQSGWIYEIVSVSGDSTKFATSGITNGVDISAGKVTLGPGEIVVVRIKGKAATTAIGNIVNTGNASYNGTDLGPKTVTLTPAPGIADLSKVVNKESYTVGGKLIYTIVVKNTGTGYLNDVTIIDDLKLIETELATGGVGKAIDSFNVVTLTKTNLATIITRDTTYANGFKATGDIYPGDTVTIVIEATLNPLAAGKITNIAKVLDSSGNEFSEDKTNNTTTVNPLPAIVQILKTVDKATYISGDTLTYKVVVGNTGTGWANGIKVTDDISGILAEIGGASVGAFESWTIVANKVAGSDKVVLDSVELTNSTTLTPNSNLDAKVSLAPFSAIEFTIAAKLKPNTTTDIKNIAKYQYDPNNPTNPTTDPKLSNEVITTPKVTELTITKLQNNLRERSGFTANPVQYWLDDVILYQIVVQNGENAIDSFEIIDNIQQILVGGSGGNNIPAYSQWSIDSIVYSDGTPGAISTKPSGIATQPSGENISVKTSLKAGEKVTVTIRAQITKGDETNLNFPQSVIKNTASIIVELPGGNLITENSNEVIFTPYPPVLERTKTITSIAGVPYTPGMTYSPGDKVVYTIGLRNTGNGVADNITVKDDIASVVTELAGGTIGSAFSTWTVTLDKSPAAKVDGTYPLSSPAVIDDIVDLGPDKYVNFIIEATVATNAIGTISPNIAIVNGEDKVTPPIPPKVGTAPSLTKKIVVEDSRLDKSEYSAGDTIVYEVTVSNLNDKIWLNDVNVVDLISDVKALNLAGVEVAAFKPNWKIEMSNLKLETIFSGTYPKNNVNLNETMDLAPGDIVKFKITATINENIVGKIINTTTGTYKKNKTETPVLGPVSVESDSKIGLASITKSPYEEFYSPGGVIGFDIVIENTSANLIDNLKLTDLISEVKVNKIGESNPVPAFKPGWTITYQVVGDTVNTNATSIPESGDINAINLDIGKNTKINIQIRGIANDGIYGEIINIASCEYANETKKDDATIYPKDPILTLVKNVNIPEYGPKDEIVYTIEIQNTGIGSAIGVELEDAIGALETTLVGIAAPGTGLAFTSWTRELTSVPATSSVVSETTDGDTYKAKLDIAPSDKIIITLRGVLDERAYGKIDNLVLLTYRDGQNKEKKLEANAETTGKSAQLFIRKTINKNVYEDEDTLVFTVLLQNAGLGWGNNIVVEDKISEILDTIVGPAFESWTIKVTKSSELSSVTTNPESLDPPTPDNKDLNVLVDIAPISQVGFEITAKLKPNVSSTIKNTAYMQKTPDSPKEPSPEVIAEPTDGTISITKSVEESVYVVGEKLTYIIEVKNSANILARDVVIKDALNNIKVVTNLGVEINPFTSWKIVSVTPSLSTLPLTSPISILPAIGVDGTTDIEIKTNIKANEVIAIKIEAIVALGNEQTGVPTGTIENKATATYEEKEIFDTAKTTPGEPLLLTTKVIKSLAGNTFDNQKYNSGDELVYEITVQNNGGGMAKDVSIIDSISAITTELAGGTTGLAFETWSTVITKLKPTTLIQPSTVLKDTDINLVADIDKGEKIVITVTAKINSKAVGVIPKNIVTVGQDQKETPEIDPKKGVLEFTKTIIDGTDYVQGGNIVYELKITNKSKTFINDVSFVDEISKIKATGLDESQVIAFKSWTVSRSDKGTGTIYNQAPNLSNVDINDKIDISPEDVLTYTITAVVEDDVVGDIVNTAYVEYVGPEGLQKIEKQVVSENNPGDVRLTKEAINPTYVPNGEIGFRVVLENISTENVANNITIRDIISTIVADKIGGGTTLAFKPGWKITSRVEGDLENTNINSLLSLEEGRDIVDLIVDLGKASKVIIEIKGIAESNIYGDIKNIASFSYPEAEKSYEREAIIKSAQSTPELTKVVDKAEYNSGDTLEYTIRIKNPGLSIIPNFVLTDEIGKIVGEIAGESSSTGLAFVSWQRVSLEIPVTSVLKEELVKDSTAGDTYKAILDLGVGDEVVLKLSAQTKSNVFGTLLNTAIGKYTEQGEGGPVEKEIVKQAVSTSKLSELSIQKTVNKDFYSQSDELTYTVTLKNTGLGWANEIIVEDKISEIKDENLNVSAFLSWTITATKTSEFSFINPEVLPESTDLFAKVDIAPLSEVTFTIVAKLKEDVTSILRNKAKFKDGEKPPVDSNEVETKPIPGMISIIKETLEPTYAPGQKLTYVIKAKNESNIHLEKVLITDSLNNIPVSTNIAGKTILPFKNWKVISVKNDKGSEIGTYLPTEFSTTPVEAIVDMDPLETVEVTIEAEVTIGDVENGVPFADIENVAVATYNNIPVSDSVKTPSAPGDVTVLKNIKTLGGVVFTGQKYKAGDIIEYEIKVKNNGIGLAKNVIIKDEISKLKVETAGGSLENAIESWTVSISSEKATTIITPNTVAENSDIDLVADIDVNDTVTILITGKINSKATGVIPKNIVTANDKTSETPEIDPEKGVLEFTKTIIGGTDYVQGGNIVYELKITNKSKTFINDVSFVDEISKIKATGLNGVEITAFKSWTVSRSDKGTGTIYNQAPNLSNVDINDKIDISPEDILIYTVTAVVEDDVVGDIVNTGYVEYVGPEGIVKLERDVVSKTNPGDVRLTKEAINPTYVPNGEIGFRVVLENISTENVANNITLRDFIANIVADKVGGGTTPAFKPGWKITSRVEGDVENSNIESLLILEDGMNIPDVVVDIGKATKIIIEIKGIAESNIYGDIKNIASFSYPDGKESYEREATIKSAQSTPELTKVVDKAEYNSGDTLEYTIRIKNPGLSIIPNFVLTDEIGKIVGEIAGESSSTGLAFVSWQRVSLEIPVTSVLKEELVKDSTAGDTYKAILDLGVGDEVVLKLSAQTKPNVFGTLLNTAIGKYTEQGEGGSVEKEIVKQAVSTGKIGLLGLTKTVKTKTLLPNTSTYLYSPGEEVEYTIVVSNNGDGWIRNAKLTDMFTEVQTKLYPNGDLGAAFEDGTLSIEYISSNSENSITILEDSPNLKAEIDIKNGSTITFIAKIKVSTEAVSIIENKAILSIKVGEKEEIIETKVKVFAKIPEVTLTKTVDLKEFNPSEKLVYTVVLENLGDNNLIGIEGTDIINDIRSLNNLGEMVYPFESESTITRLIEPENSVRVTPIETAQGNIVDKLDMKPKSKITYIIEVQVKDSIVGSIVNIAKAKILSQDGFGEDKNLESEATSTPRKPVIAIEKTVLTQLESDDKIVSGEEVTYTIKLKTDKIVFNVQLIDKVSEIKNELGEVLFDPETIKIVSVKEGESDIAYTGDINGSTSEIKISRINTEAVVIIKATVKNNVSLKSGEKITNTASANYDQQNDGGYDLDIPVSDIADVVGKAMQLELTKVATQDQVLLGEEVEYIIKVKNSGSTRALNFTVIDNISEMTELSNSGSKIPAYTSWSITGVAGPNSLIGTIPGPNINLNITDAEIAPGETLTYTIKAKTSLDLNVQKVRNIAKVAIVGLPEIEAEAEVKVKKPLVSIDKEAGVKETSIGKFVPYSLVITNNESQPIKNLYIKDTPPAGFKYIEDSLGIIKNGEKVGTIDVTYEGNTIVIGPFDLESKEQIEVVYLTKVSIGVVRGTYKNVAVVTNTSGKPVSNEDAAEVDVVEDPLFETTTVIGKVFHDRDGDGIQDDNRATGISIKQDIPENLYVPNSTYYIVDGITKAIKDQSVPLERGIKLKEILHGRMSEREDLEKSKVEIYTGLNDVSNLGDIRVTTAEGTDITLTKDNRVITNHTGLKAKGMVSQNIVLRRQILKKATNKNRDNKIKYYQKITIINTGLIEEGIPGVRVANVEGLVIITDQYGRFHIPEVSDKKGKNYILKVDATTLPIGSIFTTENPKVQRLGTTMIKYNFGVVLPRTTYETKQDGTKLLRVRVFPGILFYENSSEIKPVVYKDVFSEIMKKLKSKDHLLVELNRSDNKELDEKRKQELLKALKEYLSDEKVKVQFIQSKKEAI